MKNDSEIGWFLSYKSILIEIKHEYKNKPQMSFDKFWTKTWKIFFNKWNEKLFSKPSLMRS